MSLKPIAASTTLAVAASLLLAGCGGSTCDFNCGVGPGAGTTSYVGTEDPIVAWADPGTTTFDAAPTGVYAGKREYIRGTVSPYTGNDLGQPAGAEIYQYADGTIHLLDLAFVGFPSAVQVSTETGATTDVACTTDGTNAFSGAPTDYHGVFFAGDPATPTMSTYVYRLPGTDGVCGTADDVVHAVRMGMASTDAPLVAAAMPAAAVYTAGGDLSGFVARSGTDVVLLDASLSSPVTLATGTQAIQGLEALPIGQASGYETGRLFLLDGDIVHIDYAARTVSNPLFTVPGWTPTDTGLAATAASPDTFYFAVYDAGTATSAVYAMPADGSAAPTLAATLSGKVTQMAFPVGGSDLVVGVQAGTYAILALPAGGGLPATVLQGDESGGRFTATAGDVYWTQWNLVTAGTTSTRSALKSGISAMDGSVVMAAVPNSLFMAGGEAVPWTNGDVLTRETPLQTVFQVTGLAQTSTVSANGQTWVAPSLTGGTLQAIGTSTNAVVATLGSFGTTTSATMLDGVVHPSLGHWLFLDARTQASTQDPATHDAYLVNSQMDSSLLRVTGNL